MSQCPQRACALPLSPSAVPGEGLVTRQPSACPDTHASGPEPVSAPAQGAQRRGRGHRLRGQAVSSQIPGLQEPPVTTGKSAGFSAPQLSYL